MRLVPLKGLTDRRILEPERQIGLMARGLGLVRDLHKLLSLLVLLVRVHRCGALRFLKYEVLRVAPGRVTRDVLLRRPHASLPILLQN